MSLVKAGPGRPQKYGRPSRALTVTLPEDVLARLQTIDSDIGRAIVAVAERKTARRSRPILPAEVTSYGKRAVIVVLPVKALKNIAGVQLVPIGNGRALISLDDSRSIPQFELDLHDLLEHSHMNGDERTSLEAIAGILRDARRSRLIDVRQRTIIVLESKRRRRR